jgi:hypothetical protein
LLSQRIKCAELESWCLGMLGVLLHAPMGPFYSPRQLGAIESIPGRQFLPSVDWRTGQSGAPSDTVRCGFLSCFGAADRWRFGAVGAPDTVRCPLQTVGPATRHARIARPTVGSPDSPVNFSRTPPTKSRERPFHQSQPGVPDTVRCTTGQFGAPRLSCLWLNKAISFPN